MVVAFDLDDTLYDEMSFVISGFRAVSLHLEAAHSIPPGDSLRFMEEKLLVDGRGRIFDAVLAEFGVYTTVNVAKCVSVYRGHTPTISLYPEADECLKRLEGLPLYIVTDGNKIVQENKVKSLGLRERVKHCFFTHRYGTRHAKPSPYCFLAICSRERVRPRDVVYIGDNPHKDFVGIKPEGFRTIRVLKGQYREVVAPPLYEADHRIDSLTSVDLPFIQRVLDVKG